MKINIYYGGRGILDDPSLYVVNKIKDVLLELNVKVELFKLYEMKNAITTLPASINDSDGIILASTVEWFGIGGYISQFLDACWLYGNREKISKTYMCPVVLSTTFGERDGVSSLVSAWEILGGLYCEGISAYVNDMHEFEKNETYNELIEKAAENIYRTISKKAPAFPSSNQAIKQIVKKAPSIPLTPQESEQLSKYAADERYVKKQKEDIAELTSLFKEKMEHSGQDDSLQYISDFQKHFNPNEEVDAIYKFVIKGKRKPLIVETKDGGLNCYYGDVDDCDLRCKLDSDMMDQIVSGRITLQRAFMSGAVEAKGDIRILRMLDQVFNFERG
ncbi:MAG: SCP2 sterol-binding domain-containing protein [Lachnospiraceae bacterium]|nr:SCP2 sterol-binding domain-containing protein [Lachnospiraceae bacterium]